MHQYVSIVQIHIVHMLSTSISFPNRVCAIGLRMQLCTHVMTPTVT